MRLEEFLTKIEISYNDWDDYGFKVTASIKLPNYNKYYVCIYPNPSDESIYKQLKNNEKPKEIFLYCKDQGYYELINSLLENQTDRERWYELTGDIVYGCKEFFKYYDKLKTKTNLNDDLNYNDRDKIGIFDNAFFRDKNRKEWEPSLQQLHRITVGIDYLSDYCFDICKNNEKLISVDVKPKDNIIINNQQNIDMLPFSVSNNLFAIIGDNGSGKTTFIKSLVMAFLGESDNNGIEIRKHSIDTKDDCNIINKIIYISFSPFDAKISSPENEKKFQYIGVQNIYESKDLSTNLVEQIIKSLEKLKNSKEKLDMWFKLMNRLNSERWVIKVCFIVEEEFQIIKNKISGDVWEYKDENGVKIKIGNMSSGQKIMTLSLTNLVLEMTERTVVFFDEPELFLHPPLIKAYIRLIADLTSAINGLTFISTHSPITIQEIPDQCVKIAIKNNIGDYELEDVKFKTFGESISTINEKIFKLGLAQTGFYNLIETMSNNGELKNNIEKLKKIVGSEGRVLIKYLSDNTK